MNRYFLIWINAYNDLNMLEKIGDTVYVTKGSYPNRTVLNEHIRKEFKITDQRFVITNIVELSESDYKDWIEDSFH